MAYPISSTALDLFKTPYRQIVDIVFTGKDQTLHLTDADIPSGGLSVNRCCVSGEKIEIGSVIASELSLTLDNSDGRFDDVVFEGAEIFGRVGIKKWDARRWEKAELHYVPLGYFTVDEVPRKLSSITLTALDRMMHFDKAVDKALLNFPMDVATLTERICDICNVTCDTNVSLLPNHGYIIQQMPDDTDLTYRQLLSWIAEITGTCGFIDWNGHLILKWYESVDLTIDLSDRFSSDLHENAIVLSGVQVVADDATYLAGDDGYALSIEGNALIQHDHRDVANALYEVLGGFSYTPFSATTKPMPHLYPLDVIKFVDKKGVAHSTIITDVTFSLNKNTAIQGKGETATRSGYASANPLTKKEAAIINSIKKEQNVTLNDRIQSVLAFNELISNALGLFVTPITQGDGSVIYYLHDQPNLSESKVIFTMTSSGVAWTNSGWNDGNPVWSYGVTNAGDALFRKLSATGIEVSEAGEDYSIQVTPKTFKIYYRDMLVTNIEADQMNIPKGVFGVFMECGKTRWVPCRSNGELIGTNLVFID